MEFLSVLPGIGTLCIGVATLYLALSRDNKKDASEITTVIVKLESISTGISRVENEVSNIRQDQKEDHDRIIKVEASAHQAHKRLDDLIGGRISNLHEHEKED